MAAAENETVSGSVKIASIKQAVSAMFKLIKVENKPNRDLFSSGNLRINMKLKKIPLLTGMFVKRVRLPHSIYTENTRVCIFVKDPKMEEGYRDSDETRHQFKLLLNSLNITCISEIIPISQLRMEFSEHRERRSLARSFELFLMSSTCMPDVAQLLGTKFYKYKRLPAPVNTKDPECLKSDVEDAMQSTFFYFQGAGKLFSVTVGNLDFTEEELEENIICAVKSMPSIVPGGWNNVQLLSIVKDSSTMVPFYFNTGSPNDVVIHKGERPNSEPVEDEISTLLEGRVRVFPDGTVHVIGNSKWQHESDEDYDSDDEEGDSNEEPDFEVIRENKRAKRKKLQKLQSKNPAEHKKWLAREEEKKENKNIDEEVLYN